MSAPEVSRRPTRRLVLAAVAVVAVLAAVLAVVLLRDPGRTDDTAAPAATATAAPTAAAGSAAPAVPTNPPTPEPTGPTSDADAPPSSLAAVALTESAAVGDGVTGRLVSVEAVQGDGEGIGAVDGPALRVTVELTNGTSAPVSLDAVAVELYSGAELDPASPLDDPSATAFAGTVAPGASDRGSYVFTLPEDVRDDVTVQVAYQAGVPYLVFRGSAA